ncbi:hypothetical protein GVN16_19555 [Emticicia sp. CRIBPO]|uniref:hypothetical protein n=1 Tax=Emticicia sp. CRIBPO TaxID=2683258 RepID=UPI00141363A6|nr:hypothetical protein [Emticicia sp. CRIBPO]NBA87976.1 hypothetical protein [Emticicia sp. CRIBPO]
MKSPLYISLFLLVFMSCNKHKNEDQAVLQNQKEVLKLPISLKKQSNKQKAIREWLDQYYFHGYAKYNIEEINDSITSATIFKISLNGSYPNMLKNSYSVIYLEGSDISFLIPIEFVDSYKINNQEMIGGIYSYREFEYFIIYHINNNDITLALDSRTEGKYGLKTGYFRNDECIEYKPERLDYHYDKSTHAISFTGMIFNYCEKGLDRNKNQIKSLDSQKVNIEYTFTVGKWVLSKPSDYNSW